jgi:hypothetical protein
MIKRLKELVKNSRLYSFIKSERQKTIVKAWEKSEGRIGPAPHLLKQNTIKDYAYKFRCPVLVETGTFEGDMVKATLTCFKQIFSIELDQYLFERAVRRFKRNPEVKIVQGDSGEKLREILSAVNSRCIFWLDGHYSAGATAKGELETPIVKEIQHIFNHQIKDHVILIDDARCFNGSNDYPLLDSFVEELYRRKNDIRVEVYNDIIRITPDKAIIRNE